MQTNQYNYDRRASWTPPQSQPYNGRYVTPQDGRPQFAPQPQTQRQAQIQRPTGQKPKAPQKMPTERALALANRFKRGFAIASIVGFGTLSGLVAIHQVGTTTAQSSQNTSGSSSSNSSNSTNSSSQNGNGFLNQQGGNTGGTNSSSSSSSTNSSSSSSTVSGTHTS